MKPHYSDDSVTLYLGDCIAVLRSDDLGYDFELGYGSSRLFPDESVHAVVTDPPYGLGFMGKEWDDLPPGFDFAVEALRVLKPGGHLLAFGGSRTWHRLAVAVEDAGFEIRDSIAWLYGSGFPKSHNLDGEWEGWGTALKPAFEPIVVGRKPLKGTVAANVLAYGTGALHVDACRIPGEWSGSGVRRAEDFKGGNFAGGNGGGLSDLVKEQHEGGRWPTNVLIDESQAPELDKQSGILKSGAWTGKRNGSKFGHLYGGFTGAEHRETPREASEGGASRFFPTFRYEAKAPGTERPEVGGVQHPTVKPLDLMRWLVRLVTPPDGTVLEPFAGSGTTLEAALIEGFNVVGIEREETYLPLIMQRITKPLQQSLFGDFEGVA